MKSILENLKENSNTYYNFQLYLKDQYSIDEISFWKMPLSVHIQILEEFIYKQGISFNINAYSKLMIIIKHNNINDSEGHIIDCITVPDEDYKNGKIILINKAISYLELPF